MGEVDWASFWYQILPLLQRGQSDVPLQQAQLPFTGFLGPQRIPQGNPQGNPSGWLNIGINIGGKEWLIPQLTPNQSPEDIQALLSGQELSEEQRSRITHKAIQFAMEYEKANPGTFAKYDTSVESDAAAMGASKNLFIRDLPEAQAQYPGRPMVPPAMPPQWPGRNLPDPEER